nr:repA101 [CRIM plasmid pCAH63]
MPEPLLRMVCPKRRFGNGREGTGKRTSGLAGETASADYHHRIRRGYVSRAALNVHRHVE